MAKYRKKPVVIEAVQFFNGDGKNTIKECIAFTDHIGSYSCNATDDPHMIGKLRITTVEGVMYADDGDWIIKGIKGEFYPCKPDIFNKTYEKVDEV